jgi:hypothetical protein
MFEKPGIANLRRAAQQLGIYRAAVAFERAGDWKTF